MFSCTKNSNFITTLLLNLIHGVSKQYLEIHVHFFSIKIKSKQINQSIKTLISSAPVKLYPDSLPRSPYLPPFSFVATPAMISVSVKLITWACISQSWGKEPWQWKHNCFDISFFLRHNLTWTPPPYSVTTNLCFHMYRISNDKTIMSRSI